MVAARGCGMLLPLETQTRLHTMKTQSLNYTLVAIASGGFALLTASALSVQASAKTPGSATASATAAATPTAPAGKTGTMTSSHAGSPWFGAIVENAEAPSHALHQTTPEVRITKVFRGSPASLAGLHAGDILWIFDGGRLKNTSQFHRELLQESPGTTVPVEIYRHGRYENLKVTLGEAHHTTAPQAGSAMHSHA